MGKQNLVSESKILVNAQEIMDQAVTMIAAKQLSHPAS